MICHQSPNYQHGLVDGNIYRIISTGLQGTLCLAFMENLDYKYHAQENNDYVIPDVMIICDRKHLKGGSYTGTPRFIVETLSPATALRDMTVKKRNLPGSRCRRVLDHLTERKSSTDLLS